jgi:hypothetical protein
VASFRADPKTRFQRAMLFSHSRVFVSFVLLAFLTLHAMSSAQQQTPAPVHKRQAKKPKKAAPDPPPVPDVPPPPPTLEQMPALPPQVHYRLGQLTIAADNSTLSDILRAVRAQTGAVVEIPPNANERVVTHLGPGPAREVLATLLNGSHFNYVMMGSADHPDSVERVILTSKAGAAPPAGAVPTPQQGNNDAQMDDNPAIPQTDISEQPVEDPPEGAPDEVPPAPNGQQQAKTPEQLLRELQQQQILQQQQQQQEPPPSPGPQPGPPPQ